MEGEGKRLLLLLLDKELSSSLEMNASVLTTGGGGRGVDTDVANRVSGAKGVLGKRVGES